MPGGGYYFAKKNKAISQEKFEIIFSTIFRENDVIPD